MTPGGAGGTSNFSITSNNPDWHTEEIDLSAYAGKTIQIQFTVIDSGTDVSPNRGFGWYIDDVLLRFVDAGAVSRLRVDGVSLPEGNIGSKEAAFSLSLEPALAEEATISWSTLGIDAVDGEDYRGAQEEEFVLEAGADNAFIKVPIYGDYEIEADETFELILSNPSDNLFVEQSRATGVILNEDFPPGTLFGAEGATSPSAPMAFAQASLARPGDATILAEYTGKQFVSGDFPGYSFSQLHAFAP